MMGGLAWVVARQDADGAWWFARDLEGRTWTEDPAEALAFRAMADALQVGEAMPWRLAMQVAYSDAPAAAEA